MTSPDHLVQEYLKRLHEELADLPPARRRELEAEIAEHIVEARAEFPEEGEAEVRTLLDRLGDPSDIAAEARERFGVERRKPRALDVTALAMLLIGGVVIPVVGWVVGVILLWVSDAWNTREKLVGTLVVPGGLLVPLVLLLGSAYSESCTQEPHPVSGTIEVCTGGPSSGAQVGAVVLVTLLFLAPLATTVFLARRMKRRSVPVAVNATA